MKKHTNKKAVGILICCLFISIFILYMKSSPNNVAYNSSSIVSSSLSNKSSSNTLHSGQSVTLSDITLVCSSKENLSKMLLFMREKNADGQNQMLLSGQATILSKGTKVNIISIETTAEIEVSGKKWFAPYELVK